MKRFIGRRLAGGSHSGLAARFQRYIEWLRGEGYGFQALGSEIPDLSQSVVYLRYDVGAESLTAARLLADQHQRLRVPGVFCLAWDLVAADPPLAAKFLELRSFDPDFVHFGLYCAPVENYLCRDKFAGDRRREAAFLTSCDFLVFLGAIADKEKDRLRAAAVEELRSEAAAFAAAFGSWPTIAGRAGAWSAAFARERARRPELAPLDDIFHPVRFLAALDLRTLGFAFEAAALPGDERMGPHLMFGGGDPETVRRDHHQRVWGGGGFVAIFPPQSWLREEFDRLPSPPPIPEPLPRISDPASPILTNLEDLVPFGRRCERLGCRALAEAARKQVGPRLEPLFRRFLAWLRDAGYVIGDLEEGPPRFEERRAYLRYDVHIQDLLPAYVLADLHQRLEIPGSFQLTWRFSTAEQQLEPFFLKFREFDSRFVQIGLHCAPAATWFIAEHCGGDLARAERIVREPGFANDLRALLAAYRQEGDAAKALVRLRGGIDATMASLSQSFRAAFGGRPTVSGHGNFLAAAFARLLANEPALAPLHAYFNAVGYLQRFGVARFGFAREITVFPGERGDPPGVILESGDQALRRRHFHRRIEAGRGFLCLFHPATLTTDNLASIVPAQF